MREVKQGVARNIYKYTTMALIAFIVVVALYVLAPLSFAKVFMSPVTDNQVAGLEHIPNEWAAWKWGNGKTEAVYTTNSQHCTVSAHKPDTQVQSKDMSIGLTCEHESAADDQISEDGESHLLVTDPADFDLTYEAHQECEVGLEYRVNEQENTEYVDVDIFCSGWNNASSGP